MKEPEGSLPIHYTEMVEPSKAMFGLNGPDTAALVQAPATNSETGSSSVLD